jgi:hypothetical protein
MNIPSLPTTDRYPNRSRPDTIGKPPPDTASAGRHEQLRGCCTEDRETTGEGEDDQLSSAHETLIVAFDKIPSANRA